MRCCCCDTRLNNFEATMRNSSTGEYTDMCLKCLKGLKIKTIGREDLLQEEDEEEDMLDEYPFLEEDDE